MDGYLVERKIGLRLKLLRHTVYEVGVRVSDLLTTWQRGELFMGNLQYLYS